MTLADSLRGLKFHTNALSMVLCQAYWAFGADNRTGLRAVAAEIRSEAAHLSALAVMFETAVNDLEEELQKSLAMAAERKDARDDGNDAA